MKSAPLANIPPQDLEAEQATLGSMMISGTVAEEVAGQLSPADFYRDSHATVFRALCGLVRQGVPADLLTLREELERRDRLEKAGGLDYLVTLTNAVPTAAHGTHYAGIVADRAFRRRMIEAAGRIMDWSYRDFETDATGLAERCERVIFETAARRQTEGLRAAAPLFLKELEDAEDRHKAPRAVNGVASGFDELDRMTSGFQASDLGLLAGRPSMGKTSCALSLAQHAAETCGKPVAIFSLEMSARQLIQRLLCSEARVDSIRLKTGQLREQGFGGARDVDNLVTAAAKLMELPIFIDDQATLTPLEMRARVRRLAAQEGVGFVVIDYLQRMRGAEPAENKHQEYAEIVRSIKSTAKEIDCPIIALSQLSRGVERRDDKRPMLSDLRESGGLEAEADLVMFLYRAAYYERKGKEASDEAAGEELEPTELIIAKHRNGPVGTVTLGFLRRYARFENLVQF